MTRSVKPVVGLVVGIILLALLLVVVLGPGGDDRCLPEGGVAAGGGVPAGELSLPIAEGDYVVSSTYKSPDRPGHRGIDLAADDGTPMYAMAGGVVVEAGAASGFGNWIVIDHTIDGQSYSTVYGHMWDDGVAVSAGDTVTAGQHIGEVGNNGQSTGAHLHLEVWEGGRLSGGAETDPQQWLDRAVEPGSGDDEEKSPSNSDKPSTRPTPSPPEGGEMAESDKILSEDKLQVDSVRVARAVAQRFPDVETIGGWRPTDAISDDHPSGRAVDVMIPDFQSTEGRELGNRIKNYLNTHREKFNIEYMIWRQMYIPADGQPSQMEDRGDPTQNHFDHVHVTVAGGGMPTPDQQYGPAPTEGADDSSETSGGAADDDCAPDFGHRSLNTGEIPEELRKWIDLGGQVCREVDSPLLAGLLYHESAGFQAQAVSTAGAQGYGQFMPGTWATAGAEVDDNGEVVGPPGSGSPSDPADATMAAARYLCETAEGQKEGIASGELSGDPQSLMLAGYNAGPGAVQQYGGVPPYAETQKYVEIVPQEAEKFAAA
ncbi:MAG TPA: peptidoglycan DD-metalloendopeptidase family protein [Candidatus Dietzia intestinigallinarum]|nr:peptidoglycan DD-metalloendopeptidase family protein [Candidatus Dietzia intestinigallinarum]